VAGGGGEQPVRPRHGASASRLRRRVEITFTARRQPLPLIVTSRPVGQRHIHGSVVATVALTRRRTVAFGPVASRSARRTLSGGIRRCR